MNVTTFRPEQLTAASIATWVRTCRQRSALLTSPFLSPDFTLAVSRHRPHVEVGVVTWPRQGDTPEGSAFFPFERQGRRVAVPVADQLNDFHGVIAPAHCPLDARRLLCGLRLGEWRFHHQLADQEVFAGAFYERRPSPFVDLTRGFDDYYRGRQVAHPRTFKDQQKRWRGLAQFAEAQGWGPLRFEFDVRQPAMLDQLIEWKRHQYMRTRNPDVFAHDWTIHLLHDLAREEGVFGGVLSVLYAGERPWPHTSVCVGIRHCTVGFPRTTSPVPNGHPVCSCG